MRNVVDKRRPAINASVERIEFEWPCLSTCQAEAEQGRFFPFFYFGGKSMGAIPVGLVADSAILFFILFVIYPNKCFVTYMLLPKKLGEHETVTIQVKKISPRLLMELHYLFHPDLERYKHRKKLTVLTRKIAYLKSQFKPLKCTHSGSSGLGDSK